MKKKIMLVTSMAFLANASAGSVHVSLWESVGNDSRGLRAEFDIPLKTKGATSLPVAIPGIKECTAKHAYNDILKTIGGVSCTTVEGHVFDLECMTSLGSPKHSFSLTPAPQFQKTKEKKNYLLALECRENKQK